MAYKMMTSFVQREQRSGPTWAAANRDNRFEVPADATMSDAFRKAGMDYTIRKAPMGVVYDSPSGRKFLNDPNSFRLIREAHGDTGAMLIGDVVGPKYGLIQNMEIARMLDPLTKTWPVETVGEFESGTTVYGLLKAEGTSIGGDEMRDYFLFSDGRDGGTAVEIAYTPVRVVCWNTLQMALRTATTRVRLMHGQGIKGEAELFVQLMANMRLAQEKGHEMLNEMNAAKVDASDIKNLIEASYPLRRPTAKHAAFDAVRGESTGDLSKAEIKARFAQWEAIQEATKKLGGPSLEEMQASLESANERIKQTRVLVNSIYNEERDAHKTVGDNLWLAVNAIVEAADWGGMDADDDDEKKASRAAQTMFGRRAEIKGRAMKTAEGLMLAGRR